MENMGEYGGSTFYLYVIFKAAYDSTDRHEVLKAMEEFSLPGKLRRLVEITLKNARCNVKTENGISDPFIKRKGLRKSYALACMLFNIALDKALRVAVLDIRGTTLQKSIQILAYADDIVIIGGYERGIYTT
jgi:sorting nexin-29